MSETVTITALSGDEEFTAYVARPAGSPKAAIVVIQEIFGVNAGIRRKCDRLAEDGYLAIAPDLFWRLEPKIELDPDVEPEFQRALDLMGKFDQDQGIRDIEATIKQVREAEKIAKVGCVGYCLGGRLAPSLRGDDRRRKRFDFVRERSMEGSLRTDHDDRVAH